MRAKAKTWPDSPRALAGRLRRAATGLRKIGIDVGFEREGRARTRIINITTIGQSFGSDSGGVKPSASSAQSASPTKANPSNGLAFQAVRTVDNFKDGSVDESGATVRVNARISDAEADADASHAAHSAPENSRWSKRL